MGELQNIRTRGVAGGAAGDLTVTGIQRGDKLISVIDAAAAGPNLASEFSITADDTINNVGGTDTTGMVLIVTWEAFAGGRWGVRDGIGRLPY